MSYLVLARKYRPQTFEEVIGQTHVTRTIQNAIRSNRVAHALIFAPPVIVLISQTRIVVIAAREYGTGIPVPLTILPRWRHINPVHFNGNGSDNG